MGGAERVMATLANYCVKHGDQVRILTMKSAECAYKLDPGVEIIGANATMEMTSISKSFHSIASIIKAITKYKKELKEYQPDLVLSFLTYTNLIASIFGRTQAPVIISERCDPEKRGKILRKVVKCIFPKSNRIVCQSKTIEDYFKALKARTKVIPNPLNSECINVKPISLREKRIIAAGRLSTQKNYPVLIKAFDLIKDQIPDYVLEIYGQGPEKEKLQELINELGLTDSVFLMGTLANVMKMKADSTLYVMSSDYEGFPNALCEAMASGIPVISTDFPSGVAHEIIQNGINGYVVPVGDVAKLGEAMKNIVNNPDIQEFMSKNNEILREKFSENRICSIWRELFEEEVKKWRISKG